MPSRHTRNLTILSHRGVDTLRTGAAIFPGLALTRSLLPLRATSSATCKSVRMQLHQGRVTRLATSRPLGAICAYITKVWYDPYHADIRVLKMSTND